MWSLFSRPTCLRQVPAQWWDTPSLCPQAPQSRTVWERWTREDTDSWRRRPRRRRREPVSRCKSSLQARCSVHWVEPWPCSKPSSLCLSARFSGSPWDTFHSRLGLPRTSRLETDISRMTAVTETAIAPVQTKTNGFYLFTLISDWLAAGVHEVLRSGHLIIGPASVQLIDSQCKIKQEVSVCWGVWFFTRTIVPNSSLTTIKSL